MCYNVISKTMARDARKTVLKSIRMTEADEEVLRKDAEAKGITFNALVSSLITRYVEWDRLAERYGFIALPRQSYRYLMALLDTAELERFGRETGAINAPAIASFWFKSLGTPTFLKFLAVYAKHCRIWDYEVGRTGGQLVLTVHNDIDPAYSVAIRSYFDEAIRSIVGVAPKIEEKGNAVVFTFPESPSR